MAASDRHVAVLSAGAGTIGTGWLQKARTAKFVEIGKDD